MTDLWQRLKRRRFSGVAGTVVRMLERFIGLLEIPTPDPDQVFRRITMMERDIFLPLKAAGIAMILYSFNHGQWIRIALDELSIAIEWTNYFLWYYIPANILIACALLAAMPIRTPARGKSMPYPACSASCHAAPRPNSSLPPEM